MFLYTEYLTNLGCFAMDLGFPCSWGEIITESEILAEYFDMTSKTSKPRLIPSDAVKASHMRLAMKKFNDVVPG